MHQLLRTPDTETLPFSEDFQKATTQAEKYELAPTPQNICACIEPRAVYRYFEPNPLDMAKFADILCCSAEVITFNGEGFDILVLQRHFGEVFATTLSNVRSIDMMLIVQREIGVDFRVSLHKLAMSNLGKGKMVKGRSMAALDLDGVKRACRSDVKQTYAIWRLWREGQLNVPKVPTYQNIGDDEGIAENWPGSQLVLPTVCPSPTCAIRGRFWNYSESRGESDQGVGWPKVLVRTCSDDLGD